MRGTTDNKPRYDQQRTTAENPESFHGIILDENEFFDENREADSFRPIEQSVCPVSV